MTTLYYSVYDMTTGKGANYLGTLQASDRTEAHKIVNDVLGLNEDEILLMISIELWYNHKPIGNK